jgi:hypothetical protein
LGPSERAAGVYGARALFDPRRTRVANIDECGDIAK